MGVLTFPSPPSLGISGFLHYGWSSSDMIKTGASSIPNSGGKDGGGKVGEEVPGKVATPIHPTQLLCQDRKVWMQKGLNSSHRA